MTATGSDARTSRIRATHPRARRLHSSPSSADGTEGSLPEAHERTRVKKLGILMGAALAGALFLPTARAEDEVLDEREHRAQVTRRANQLPSTHQAGGGTAALPAPVTIAILACESTGCFLSRNDREQRPCTGSSVSSARRGGILSASSSGSDMGGQSC